ncbi:hypothetical protein SD81_031825 [Tolypothrix campylonemoides VB511288]|nr:hypothetical protein SD81_031825 [Tolypothrix campylonemoides VB511288]
MVNGHEQQSSRVARNPLKVKECRRPFVSLPQVMMNYEPKAKVHIRLEGEFLQHGMNYILKYGAIHPLSILGYSHKNLAILVLQPLSHACSTGCCLSKDEHCMRQGSLVEKQSHAFRHGVVD